MPIELVPATLTPPLSAECMTVLEVLGFVACAVPVPQVEGLNVRIFDEKGNPVVDIGADISAANLRALLGFGRAQWKAGFKRGADAVADHIRRALAFA